IATVTAVATGTVPNSAVDGVPPPPGVGMGVGVRPRSQSPFVSSVFGEGHFSGAFGSALFPVSSHQGGRAGGAGRGGVMGVSSPLAEGSADLTVDPFANSSGALAAMLGVTLPPVDSQSSLAHKMKTGGLHGMLEDHPALGVARGSPA
ncbi:unnamed protein product, partial [Discosporangium mesarthrocarpum]